MKRDVVEGRLNLLAAAGCEKLVSLFRAVCKQVVDVCIAGAMLGYDRPTQTSICLKLLKLEVVRVPSGLSRLDNLGGLFKLRHK